MFPGSEAEWWVVSGIVVVFCGVLFLAIDDHVFAAVSVALAGFCFWAGPRAWRRRS